MSELIYVTKYAISGGVEIVELEVDDHGYAKGTIGLRRHFYSRNQWERTEEEAIKNVKKKVAAKLKSFQKAVVKMTKLQEQLDAGKLPMNKADV